MALTDDSGVGRRKPPPPPPPMYSTDAERAGLDLMYSNVSTLPRYEDQMVAFDHRTGMPTVQQWDEVLYHEGGAARPAGPPQPVAMPFKSPPVPWAATLAVFQQMQNQLRNKIRLSQVPSGYRSPNVQFGQPALQPPRWLEAYGRPDMAPDFPPWWDGPLDRPPRLNVAPRMQR